MSTVVEEVSESGPYSSDWVCRFDGEDVVGGFEIAEDGNMRAYLFSSVTMEVRP